MWVNKNNLIVPQGDIILDPTSRDYIEFWKEEKRKCKEGITIGGVFFPGELYHYINHWLIELDETTKLGSFKKRGRPLFRDVEWELAMAHYDAELQRKGLIIVGARGFGKSYYSASLIGHMYTFFDDSECVVSGGNSDYIRPLTTKIELGLTSYYPPFLKERSANDWNKKIEAGVKKKDGSKSGSNCRIIVRNYKEGSDTMACNGTRPKRQILEEIGTFPVLACYNDTWHCWINDDGQFCTPILIGTGGDFEMGSDAMKMFNNPEAYNLLKFEDKWENSGKSIGMFVPADKARTSHKDKVEITEYLGIQEPDLAGIQILSTNFVKAKEYYEERRERARKANDPYTYLKEIMYNPKVPSEAFLKKKANIFPTELIKKQILFVETDKFAKNKGIPCKLEWHEGQVAIVQDAENLRPLDFPIKDDQSLEGCVMIYEPPIDDPIPYGMYIASTDPIDMDNIIGGSIYATIIWKQYGDGSRPAYDFPVATYFGRKPLAKQCYEITRQLCHLYNAVDLFENDRGKGFEEYFTSKNDLHLLKDKPGILDEIIKNSRVGRAKGYHAVDSVKDACINWSRDWLQEIDGEQNSDAYNVKKILDLFLLKQLYAFDTEGNFDAVDAFCGIMLHKKENRLITSEDVSAYAEARQKNWDTMISRWKTNNRRTRTLY